MGETEGEWSIYGFPGLLRSSSSVLKVTAAMHHSIKVLESMGWHTTTCLSVEALHQVFCVKSCSDHGHDQLCDLKNISRPTLGFLKYKMGEHTDCVEAWARLWYRERERLKEHNSSCLLCHLAPAAMSTHGGSHEVSWSLMLGWSFDIVMVFFTMVLSSKVLNFCDLSFLFSSYYRWRFRERSKGCQETLGAIQNSLRQKA